MTTRKQCWKGNNKWVSYGKRHKFIQFTKEDISSLAVPDTNFQRAGTVKYNFQRAGAVKYKFQRAGAVKYYF